MGSTLKGKEFLPLEVDPISVVVVVIIDPISRVVVIIVLLFYVHGKQLGSYRDGQLTLAYLSREGVDLLSG